MLGQVLSALETSALAIAMKQSAWAIPVLAVGHLAGVALLVGAIVPMDLRLLGVWSRMPTGPLIRVLIPTAAFGFVVATVTGGLLFCVGAREFWASPLFQVKLALFGIAVLNILAVRVNPRWKRLKRDWDTTDDFAPRPGVHLAFAGLNSILLWGAVLVLGRLILQIGAH